MTFEIITNPLKCSNTHRERGYLIFLAPARPVFNGFKKALCTDFYQKFRFQQSGSFEISSGKRGKKYSYESKESRGEEQWITLSQHSAVQSKKKVGYSTPLWRVPQRTQPSSSIYSYMDEDAKRANRRHSSIQFLQSHQNNASLITGNFTANRIRSSKKSG